MVDEQELLEFLRELNVGPWHGQVWRHMLAGSPPDRENTRGARWNPAGVAAIYTSLERETALAEVEYHLSLQPVRPKVPRTMYRLRVALERTIQLGLGDLGFLGVTEELLGAMDLIPCQRVGGAAASLGCDGLIAPSARHPGTNLVIFPANRSSGYWFEIVEEQVIDPGAW